MVVGGSLRIPAHYCGIYSLKPTVRRISTAGGRSEFVRLVDWPILTVIFSTIAWVHQSCSRKRPYGTVSVLNRYPHDNDVNDGTVRSVGDLKLASKLLFGASNPHSPQAYPAVPYKEAKLPNKLKFGYYLSGRATMDLQTLKLTMYHH